MGRLRRNILTFREVTFLYGWIILYFLLETALVFFIYKFQDFLGQRNVFYLAHSIYGVFDFSIMVVLPSAILYKSYTDHPEVWMPIQPRSSKFHLSPLSFEPRRDPVLQSWSTPDQNYMVTSRRRDQFSKKGASPDSK